MLLRKLLPPRLRSLVNSDPPHKTSFAGLSLFCLSGIGLVDTPKTLCIESWAVFCCSVRNGPLGFQDGLQAFLRVFRQGQTASRSANELCECERVRIWRSEPLTIHGLQYTWRRWLGSRSEANHLLSRFSVNHYIATR